MDMERVDIIDENNQVIGENLKTFVHAQGLRHRVSAILLQNAEGKYLIPTATDKKVEVGGLYHSAAGHVPSGESHLQSATRELWEETGLSADESQFELLGTFWLSKDYPTRIERERFEVFRIQDTQVTGEIKFNGEQADEQWLSETELRDIYLNSREKLSYPLLLSCEHIFGFGEEEK